MSIVSKLKALQSSEPGGEPKTILDRVIANTPVVMTVVATILAGLSSGEMSTAQYNRAMAAQFQSKAGDQWSFYQAKRLRESGNQNSIELLEGLVGPGPLDAGAIALQAKNNESRLPVLAAMLPSIGQSPNADALTAAINLAQGQQSTSAAKWKAAFADPQIQTAITYLSGDGLPTIQEQHADSPAIQQLLAAIDAGQNETETVDLVRKVDRKDLDAVEAAANANANAFDASTKPIISGIDRLGKLVASDAAMLRGLHRNLATKLASASPPTGADPVANLLNRVGNMQQMQDEFLASFSTARLRFDARRYHQESAYNSTVARLYEVEVRRSSGLSDRNRLRSRDFFYGMLVAQAAVTIATFSLAVKQKSFLWGLASAAGLLAISLGVYVYAFT
jgi:uncharacterized protein DUF4337